MEPAAVAASQNSTLAGTALDEGELLLQTDAASHLSPAGDQGFHSLSYSHAASDKMAAVQPFRPPVTSPTCSPDTTPASRSYSSNSSHYSLQIGSSPSSNPDHVLLKAERAVSGRLLPPLLLLVIISYLDRTALSFASIQMSHDLNLSSSMYGLGSGAFFLAYAAGQIPSNFLLLRFGGPAWLAFICVAWGAAASCMALVRGPVSFVLLRMLLGLAESGAFPGTWYYISCWYPADRTTVPYTVIETGITVSQVVAAPIAAGLLLLDGKLGLRGWQWLFMIEGLPAVLLGCFMTWWLPASIQTASFLSEPQRLALLKATGKAAPGSGLSDDPSSHHSSSASADTDDSVDVAVSVEASGSSKECEAAQLLHRPVGKDTRAGADSVGHSSAVSRLGSQARPSSAAASSCGVGGRSSNSSLGRAGSGGSSGAPYWRSVVAVARNRAVVYAGSWRILHDMPGNGVLYWTPKIVQALLLAAGAHTAAGSSSPGVAVVLFSAIPYAAASFAHLLNAWHSQRVGEVKLHISCMWLLGAVALVMLPFAASGALSEGSGISASTGASVAAFALLTVAHVGVNGANGLQTGLVAGCLSPEQKALGLAMYNTIACMGSFLGPLLIGVIRDATHGYSVAMWVLGGSLAAAALMVYRFKAPRP